MYNLWEAINWVHEKNYLVQADVKIVNDQLYFKIVYKTKWRYIKKNFFYTNLIVSIVFHKLHVKKQK